MQVIDLDLLQPPLKAFPDELESEFGVEGHIAIAPVTIENDKIIDEALLREWAVTRKTGAAHFLTVALHNAVVHVDLRRPR